MGECHGRRSHGADFSQRDVGLSPVETAGRDRLGGRLGTGFRAGGAQSYRARVRGLYLCLSAADAGVGHQPSGADRR